jgi:hypothetical protein
MSEMKPIQQGIEEINGEKVMWTYYKYEKIKRGELRTFYDGQRLIEDDHGFGLEHALSQLRIHVKNIQSNKETQKESNAKT